MKTQQTNHTVSSHFARRYLSRAQALGLDRQGVLSYAALAESALDQPDGRLAPYQLARLLNRIMVDADDEFMGLTAQRCRFGVFNLLAEHLIHCKNLEQALKETQRFYQLVTGEVLFRVEKRKQTALIHINLNQPDLDSRHILSELLILVWHRFPSWLVAEVIAIESVHLTMEKPRYHEEYRLLFPCDCTFGSNSNYMVWPLTALEQPIQRRPEQLQRYLDKVPLVWFRKLQFEDIQTDRVLLILKQNENLQTVTLEQIASQLHMTSRTLRRKLNAEGSQFQNLKDSVRRERAIYLLSQPEITIKEAAHRVGYTETASFIRAFKQWTGESPGQYRKELMTRKIPSP